MNKVELTKSSYCTCVQCEKLFWLKEYKSDCVKKDDEKPPVFETGKKVGELAKGLFGDYEDVPTNISNSQRIQKTEELLKDKPNIITEASFSYDNNFCSVDILKNDFDGVEIYEVKSKSNFKEINMDDPAYQYFVLSNLGLNVKKVYVVYLNKKYHRGKELDINQLFKVRDVTDVVLQKQDEIRRNIDRINNVIGVHDENCEPVKELGLYCIKPDYCEFWEYCARDLPKPNVFDIWNLGKAIKVQKFKEGKISFEDLEDDEDIIADDRFIQQVDFELHDREPEINKEEIKKVLSSLKYPLYFIDYEACQFAIPQYEDTFPYQQIPFQYSLHIIRHEGALPEHREFLAEVDDENMIRNFAESMIKDLSEDGSVIVYNQKFEKSLVNKKLCKMYDDLKPEIKRINNNIVDFMNPFCNRHYYLKEMEGSCSIKKVLPALYPDDPELNYDNLPSVHNGIEAPKAFLSLRDKTPEEQEKIMYGLLKYCELDTLAMVKIFEKFKEVTSDD